MWRYSCSKLFAVQVLNSGWKISESEKVAGAAKPYLKLSSAVSKTEHKSLWKRPRGVPLVPSFVDDITLFISMHLMDMTLYDE